MQETENTTDDQLQAAAQDEVTSKVTSDTIYETEQTADGASDETEEEGLQAVSIESLQAELAAAQVTITAQQEDVLRAQAEVVNMRRRTEQDVAKAHKFGQEKLLLEILGLIDNLERAIKASKDENATLDNLLEGVEMSQSVLLDGLKKFNVEQLDPHGEPFDPALHEAMTAVPNPDMEPNTVMDVFQKGYTLHGRLIRPAMVVVSKAP